MKRVIFFLFIIYSLPSYSQTYALELSVQLTAVSSSGPDAVTLQWLPFAGATQYKIYRKLPSAGSWGTAIAILTASDSSYMDNTVVNGTSYEYRVERIAPTTAYGYALSGVGTQLIDNNGIMVLVVDSFFLPALNTEITQLVNDYEADGWFVKQVQVNRNQSVASIKSQVQAVYNQDIANTKALMLLGHIPVPYSGQINPDGHPDHYGAWPADVFYADMDGAWTDAAIDNDTTASDPRNDNIPGDGKYDQSELPSIVELQTGRVDFYNLPAFTATETQLMQNYLLKLHAFKTRVWIPNDVAVVEDNFGGYAEGFGASGYKNFSVAVGPENIYTTDWLGTLDTINALWSYGCGGGWYQGASGIASSTDFATDSVLSVFNMLFGSYFGDWDVQNSFLRAPLGSGTVLTNVWAGRPHWQFHQMALGYTIGYSTLKTQNNTSTYFTSTLDPGYFGRWVHIALMGDPSLRLHYIAPPSNLVSIEDGNHVVHLSFIASTETVNGYYIYRKLLNGINWTRLNNTLFTGLSYNDSTLTTGGDYQYMVRAARDQQTASGTYENLSLGTMASVSSNLASINIEEDLFSLYPNPASDQVTIRLSNPLAIETAVFVYNSLGEQVLTTMFKSFTNQLSLDISPLSSGVYYVQTGNYTCKFIRK
jgi:hypothetical protein